MFQNFAQKRAALPEHENINTPAHDPCGSHRSSGSRTEKSIYFNVLSWTPNFSSYPMISSASRIFFQDRKTPATKKRATQQAQQKADPNEN